MEEAEGRDQIGADDNEQGKARSANRCRSVVTPPCRHVGSELVGCEVDQTDQRDEIGCQVDGELTL